MHSLGHFSYYVAVVDFNARTGNRCPSLPDVEDTDELVLRDIFEANRQFQDQFYSSVEYCLEFCATCYLTIYSERCMSTGRSRSFYILYICRTGSSVVDYSHSVYH